MRRLTADAAVNSLLDAVTGGQGSHPRRQNDADLADRKFIQHRFQHISHLRGIHIQTVDGERSYVIGIGKLTADLLRSFALRLRGVDKHKKRLVQSEQLPNDTGFGIHIAFARDIGHRTVCRDDQTDG